MVVSGTHRVDYPCLLARHNAKTIRELLTAQPQPLTKRENSLGGRVVDDPARQINLASHMGKNLAQGRLDLAAELSSFHLHLSVPLFLFAMAGAFSVSGHHLLLPLLRHDR